MTRATVAGILSLDVALRSVMASRGVPVRPDHDAPHCLLPPYDDAEEEAAEYEFHLFVCPFCGEDKRECPCDPTNRAFALRELSGEGLFENSCGGLLEYFSEALRGDRDVVLTAVSNYGGALEHASEALRGDLDVVRAAVVNQWEAFEHASEALRADHDFVMEALAISVFAFRFASEALRGNRAVVLFALGQDSSVFEDASLELRNDRGFMLDAVRINNDVFRFASEALRDDEELALLAVGRVSRWCGAGMFAYASERLRADVAFVVAAIRVMPYAMSAAALRDDADAVLAVWRLWEAQVNPPSPQSSSLSFVIRVSPVRWLDSISTDLFEDSAFLRTAKAMNKHAVLWAIERINRYKRPRIGAS